MKSAIIFGATSTIAQEILPCLFSEYDRFVLVGRNNEILETLINTHKDKGKIELTPLVADLVELENHQQIFNKCSAILGEINLILFAHGILPNANESKTDWSTFRNCLDTNFTSVVSLIYTGLPTLLKSPVCQIAVLSSVAADRARKSNYPYGCSKSALSYFLQGLRAQYSSTPLVVTTLVLGMVDTAMTKHMEKGPLFSSATQVGKICAQKILQKVDTGYVPSFWFWVMLIIKLIPEKIFKRLNF